MAALFAASCVPELDGSTRLVGEGRVTDASGTPLANTTLSVQAIQQGLFTNLHTVQTDADGRFKVAFISPVDKSVGIYFEIESEDPQYLTTYVNGLRRGDFVNYYKNLETIRLYRDAELVRLQVDYPAAAYQGAIENVYLTADGALDRLDDGSLPTFFRVARNQQAVLHYTRLATEPGQSNQEEEKVITIGDTDVVFTLTL